MTNNIFTQKKEVLDLIQNIMENSDTAEILEEKYKLYHKDFSSAMKHAYDTVKKMGYEVDPESINDKVAFGPRKPSGGKTNSYRLDLLKKGKPQKKGVQIQVYNMDNKSYELNMYLEEVELAALLCETTFSAFDSDGDGVVDDKDAFPNDPDETVDSDGDGVGDNADIAPSVANDLLYATGGMALLVLAGLLLFFLKGGMGGSGLVSGTNQHWDDDRHSAMQDEMLGMNNSFDKDIPQLDGHKAPFGDPMDSEMPYSQPEETVATTLVEVQPTITEPQISAAQNIAASEASNELLGNDSTQPPQKTSDISEVLEDLFD